jgi:UDP-N-acetylmuramyl pentapeptide phosphotransferase/UDP-N-acetylglucosamine-1-phosphate transferase
MGGALILLTILLSTLLWGDLRNKLRVGVAGR